MSKNGKLLFRGYDPYITSSFGYRIHPITGKKTMHDGVDYGTNDKKLPTYAIEEGKVVKTGYTSTNGNYVYVTYPRLGKNAIYQHLDRILVKANQSVNKDTIIGYTGATGAVTGIHLHFGWFRTSDQNKGWYSRKWEDFEKYNYVAPISYLGTPVKREESVDQIEVVIKNLYVRKTPKGEILGFINPGMYTILDKEELTEYTWYKIGESMWIAYSNEFAKLYLKKKEESKEEEKNEEDKEETIEKGNSKDETKKDMEREKKNLFLRVFDVFLEILQKILKFFKIL